MPGGGREGNVNVKNAIKHEKGDYLDFLTTQSTTLKNFWPQPQMPTPWVFNHCASMP